MAESNEPFILIIEDDPDHSVLIEAAFKKNLAHAKTHLVLSGRQARAYLARESPHHDLERSPAPSAIVLDLGLPDITGFDILEWMAEWDWMRKIPVIVFTASEDPEHEHKAYAMGATRYLRKPNDYGALVDVVKDVLRPWTETKDRKIRE